MSKRGRQKGSQKARRKRDSSRFTDQTLNWFRLGEEMGETPIEGEYAEEPPRLDLRALPGRLVPLTRRLAGLPRLIASHPRAAGAVAAGLVAVLWLLS